VRVSVQHALEVNNEAGATISHSTFDNAYTNEIFVNGHGKHAIVTLAGDNPGLTDANLGSSSEGTYEYAAQGPPAPPPADPLPCCSVLEQNPIWCCIAARRPDAVVGVCDEFC